MHDEDMIEYMEHRFAYSAVSHKGRKVAKMHPMKRLKAHHFWAWFVLAMFVELLALTACIVGIIVVWRITHTEHPCQLTGLC